jgi:hypothetical protein
VTVRRVTMLLTGVAAASSGSYMIIYLARWQWNRTLIAAVFFVAAEVALVAQILVERMRRLEGAVQAMAEHGPRPPIGPRAQEAAAMVRRQLRDSSPRPERHFAWLLESPTQHNVFLPVLLGAGVIASALAWLVETIARRVAQPVLDRPAVVGLARLTFPPAGLLDEGAHEYERDPAPERRGPARRWMVVLAAAMVVPAMWVMIDVLADATQTRPDELSEGVVTVVDVRLNGSRALGDGATHGRDLYWMCASESFVDSLPEPLVVPLSESTVRFVLHADLGDHGATRFRGCIDDTVLEEVQARVLRLQRLEVDR